MKKGQFDKLSKFEQSFKEAKAGYYRAIKRTDINEMASIYEELGYFVQSKTCNSCILKMLQNLGKEYDTYKNKHKKDDASSEL